jgi:hypothetical protein
MTLSELQAAVSAYVTADDTTQLNRAGYCACGCGEQTSRIETSCARRGLVRGEFRKYVKGHSRRLAAREFVVEDRGYITPCWIWQLTLDDKGYGHAGRGGKVVAMHRFHFEQRYGPVPPGRELDHLCRQRSCVNPEHLELVTHAENCRRGKSTKLDWERVTEIRRLAAKGAVQRRLAERFGVTEQQIHRIVKGKCWVAA